MVKPVAAIIACALALCPNSVPAQARTPAPPMAALAAARAAAGLPPSALQVRSLKVEAVRTAGGVGQPVTFTYLAPSRLRLDHVVSAALTPEGFWRHPDSGAVPAAVRDAFVARMWDYLVLFLLDLPNSDAGLAATRLPDTAGGIVILLNANQGFSRRLLFDSKTHLLDQMSHSGTLSQDGGATTVQRRVAVTARQRVDGVLWPWELTETIGSDRAVYSVRSVALNREVTTASFTKPR